MIQKQLTFSERCSDESRLPDPDSAVRGRRNGGLHWAITALCAALLVLFSGQVFAQMDTGSVTGTVKDPSGAVIANAACKLTNVATGVAQTTKSTSAGAYTFSAVPAGTYTLQVTAPGFKDYLISGIQVHVQNIVTSDVPMQVGEASAQVTVTSAVPLLQAQDASVGMTINSKMANDLPIIGGGGGRDFRVLAQLAPGVYSTSSPNSNTIYAQGVENGQVDIRLNGVDDNLEFYGGTTILPIPDSIQEFKFMDGNNGADFGHSTGAVMNAITYTGTNEFHGHVWEYIQNEAFNANDYFAKLNNKPRAKQRHNEFGGLIGGPVMLPGYNGHDHTFFFFDFQRALQDLPIQYTQTVPTVAMQSPNAPNLAFTNMQDLFTRSTKTLSDALGRSFRAGTIFDPATTRQIPLSGVDPVTGLTGTPGSYVRDPFYACTPTGGCAADDGMAANLTKDYTTPAQMALLNILPASRLDPNAIKLLQLLPLPNEGAANLLQNNYFADPNKHFDSNQYDGRIDETLSTKDSIWGSYSHFNPIASATTPYPGPAEGALGVNYATTNPSYMIVTSWTHAFSATLLNEFRFGVNSNYQTRIDPYANVKDLPSKFGIPGIPQNDGNGGLPVISTGVINDYGGHRFAPTIQTARVFAYQDNVTKIVGKHEFKFGGEYNHLMSDIIQPAYPKGWFNWNGQYSDIPNNKSGLTGMADMLLTPVAANPYYASIGGMSTAASPMGGLSDFHGSNWSQTNYHAPYAAVYAQDNWKLTPYLTVNLGLRWDYFGAYASDNGQEANFIMGPNGPIQDGNNLGAYYLIGHDACKTNLGTNFTSLLAQIGIPVVCSSSNAVTKAQRTNFGPRLGVAYRVRPSLVVRAGAGMAYGALDSVGYGGTLGTNYPFQFTYNSPNSNTSQIPLQLPGSTTTATMENAFAAVSLTDPTSVNPLGMSLSGKNYYYQTPYTISLNLQLQWQFTRRDSIQTGYVGTLGRHLDSPSTTHNAVYEMLTPTTPVQTLNQTNPALSTGFLPYNQLGTGELQMTNMISSYHSWQTLYQRQFADGSSLTASYVFSRCLSDNIGKGGLGQGIRALWLPGMGARADYTLCNADITHVVKANGELAVPVGKGAAYFAHANTFEDAVVGGWRFNFILTHYSGLPFTVGCQMAPGSKSGNYNGGFGCNAPLNGTDPYKGFKTRTAWINKDAFQPMPYNPVTVNGQNILSDLGTRGNQVRGPQLLGLDASLHKQFAFNERMKFEIRAEAQNVLNHVAFGNPGQLNFLNTGFATITGDRTGARTMQLAGKFFF